MFKARNRLAVRNEKLVSSRVSETAHNRFAATSNIEMAAVKELANFTLSGTSNNSISVSAIGSGTTRNLDLLLSGFIDERNEYSLRTLYRDIYYYDMISGGAADMISTLPFSDFALTGLDSKEINIFMDSVDRLNLKTTFPEFSLGYLVDSVYLGTLVYSTQMKIFTDILPHDPQNCTFDELPFQSQDPLIKVKQSQELKRFLTSEDTVIKRQRSNYSQKLLAELSNSEFTLDPITTVFLPRRGLNGKMTSFFRRVLPWYLLEKMLLRGTLVEFSKRQRSALHAACLSGNTLVSTENGLKRIDSLVKHSVDDAPFSVKLSIPVKGYDGKTYRTTRWHYRGVKNTIVIKTETGRTLTCTPDHKVQVLDSNGSLKWKEAACLTNELVCVSIGSNDTDSEDLSLTPYAYSDNYGHGKNVTIPTKMTEDLAYILGALTGDGTVRNRTVNFKSNDRVCALAVKSKMEKVFNTNGSIEKHRFHAYYEVNVHSVALVDYLEQLGVYVLRKANRKKPHSAYRGIPDTILTSSNSCKYAFIAGYLDTDGSVGKRNKTELTFYSISKKLIRNLQILLNELGYLSNVSGSLPDATSYGYAKQYVLRVSTGSATKLYEKLKPYIKDARRKVSNAVTADIGGYGIPVTGIIDSLDKRRTSKAPTGQKAVNCKIYLEDDSGRSINPIHNYGETTDKIKRRKVLSYKDDTGLLEKLVDLASCSKEMSKNLATLIKCNYKFERVVSVKSGSVRPVYDLSMQAGCRNAFVANSIIVHNCGSDTWEPTPEELQAIVNLFQQADFDPLGPVIATRNDVQVSEIRNGGDFFKITDIIDTTNQLKLRALGISEDFLSGSATYSTAEAALSVFIENLKAYRDFMTQQVFYKKMFPLIAHVNGFVKTNDAGQTATTTSFKINDSTKYRMPQVRWHKSLQPHNDRDTMDLLTQLSEKGIPVTLRMWAAAGGVDVDTVMRELDEDKKLRLKIAEVVGVPDQEGDMGGEFAAVRDLLAPLKPVGWVNRDYGDAVEVHTHDHSGKKKHVFNQTAAIKKQNEALAKTLKAMSDPNHYAAVRDRTMKRLHTPKK